MPKEKLPTYSVCICNYNMGDTIERALISVLDQLDDDYEVLVVDDGSSDDSREVLSRLALKYPILRVIALPRDNRRKLGETRNFSVKEAKGDYVILHVDADDVWEPFIKDFVTLFHRLEACLGRDVLVSGQQINIGKRSFLMGHGPYRNTHRAQDRDMWLRLAALDSYFPIDHRVFRTRLSRPKKVSFFKSIRDTWYHLMYDMRRGTAVGSYIWACLTGVFVARNPDIKLKTRILRGALILPVFVASRFEEPLPPPANMKTHAQFAAYRDRTRGTFPELLERYGCSSDISDLSPESQTVFRTRLAS
jgi:glycosyltransferase involved in cell wall biosynthesis